ncbi:hypothetical protein L9F63_015256, partial [Diploptera punctata]
FVKSTKFMKTAVSGNVSFPSSAVFMTVNFLLCRMGFFKCIFLFCSFLIRYKSKNGILFYLNREFHRFMYEHSSIFANKYILFLLIICLFHISVLLTSLAVFETVRSKRVK